MAALSDTDENREPCAFAKADVRLAVNTIDDYLDGMLLTRPASSLRAAAVAPRVAAALGLSGELTSQLGAPPPAPTQTRLKLIAGGLRYLIRVDEP